MKALKSQFARTLLKNPDNARVLQQAILGAGLGPDNGVRVILTSPGGQPVVTNLYRVPKPQS